MVKLLNSLVMKRMAMATIIVLCAMAFAGCNDKVSDEVREKESNTEQTSSQATLYRGVTAEEYSNSDVDLRRLIDLVDGAANALFAMQQNGANRGFEAQIIFSTGENSTLANSVIISRPSYEERALAVKTRGGSETCKACGIRSGYNCYKKIKEKMKREKKEEIDINLKLDGDCVVLTY